MNQKLSFVVMGMVAVVGAGACRSDDPAVVDEAEDQAALLALLEDAPLTQVPPGAAATAATTTAARVRSNLVSPTVFPAGVWNFDDCTASRTQLGDASGNNNTAFRSVGVACTGGVDGTLAVAFAAPEDLVYVPDQPSFTFEGGVTVAGWFKPDDTGGTRTLFRKRDKGTSSFALVLQGGKFKFVIGLADGRAISVATRTKARLGEFQHVAASYDGSTARLYLDGVEVNRLAVTGSIPPGPGPLLLGNDGSERRFSGAIDSALFATHALTPDEIFALLCFAKPPTMITGQTFLFTPSGTTAMIDIAVTNHNPAICAPIRFSLSVNNFDTRIAVEPAAGSVTGPVPGGATVHLTVTATPAEWVEADTAFPIEAIVDEPIFGVVDIVRGTIITSEPAGCHVNTGREVMITNPQVVDDPVRTAFDPASSDPRNGVWTFKHLMESMAPSPADAPAMVEAMFDSFAVPQTINGFTVAARPGAKLLVLDHWPRVASGALDLGRAPLRLQAIVNRFDLRDLAAGHAGQARFVFAFNDPASPSAAPMEASLIFEYHLPAATAQDVAGWAQAFHALGALPFGEDYNAALQEVTERFAGRGADPGRVNGSAISSVRTNDFAFANAHRGGRWELRQFELSAASGRLEPAPLERTPDAAFNGTAALASFITANQAAILADQHTVPAMLDGQPFQAGAIFNTFDWTAPGVDPDARHHFAMNTCNGCHSLETGAGFFQIRPRPGAGSEAILSPFLIGTTAEDPVTGQPRTFGDLARRHADLKAAVCGHHGH